MDQKDGIKGQKKICEAKYEQSMLIKLTKACKNLLFIY